MRAANPDSIWPLFRRDGTPVRLSVPDAILANLFARLGGEWDGFRVEPTEYLDAGDHVVALGRYHGTYKPTGRGMSAAFAHVWTLRDGRVVRYRQYADTRKMAEAL